jgi:hypothetical protein
MARLLFLLSLVCAWRLGGAQSDASSAGGNGAVEIDDQGNIVPDIPTPQNNCHAWTGASCDWEPNLNTMTVEYGSYNETFDAYVTPDVSTFYNLSARTKKASVPFFNGQYGKFINMSPNSVRVHWHSPGYDPVYITDIEPFGSSGTATYPGHVFQVTLTNDKRKRLVEWTIQAGNSLYYYDPYNGDAAKAEKSLTKNQYSWYYMQLTNQLFAKQYRQFTGTDYLALYKQRLPPRYHMWRADSLGQTHVVTTSEIHYTELPPDKELKRGTSIYGPRPDEIGRMRRYRDQQAELTLQLKVLSCAPRVFEIQNFLSSVEVEHILDLAAKSTMQRSSTLAGHEAADAASLDDATRTSKNTWIPRNTDMITDAIHRRAADLLQINESLLRWRRQSEVPEFPESMISIAERLQLVHYDVGQRTYACMAVRTHCDAVGIPLLTGFGVATRCVIRICRFPSKQPFTSTSKSSCSHVISPRIFSLTDGAPRLFHARIGSRSTQSVRHDLILSQ